MSDTNLYVLHFVYMANYVGQREQFVDNYGPQNEAQNETHCAKVFKMSVGDRLEFHSIAFQNAGLETCH
jgi:hypothetical protein